MSRERRKGGEWVRREWDGALEKNQVGRRDYGLRVGTLLPSGHGSL